MWSRGCLSSGFNYKETQILLICVFLLHLRRNIMKFYTINKEYIDYLYQVDPQVMKDDKDRSRLYVGIIHPVKWFNYLIPLSSAKPDKDYEILADGTQFARSGYDNSVKYVESFSRYDKLEVCAKLMMGKMIPVPRSEFKAVQFDKINDIQYRSLVIKEYEYIQKHKHEIKNFCENQLYKSITKGIDYMNIDKDKCVDFNLLENRCRQWVYDLKIEQEDFKELFDELEYMGYCEQQIENIKKDIFYGYDFDDIRYKIEMDLYKSKSR